MDFSVGTACKQRVAVIENRLPKVIVLVPDVWGNQRRADEPGVATQETRERGSRVILLGNHSRDYRSPSRVCDSSAMMRNRALVVRSISACRRGDRKDMDGYAASLPRRSSTQASALACTVRTIPMSIRRSPWSLILLRPQEPPLSECARWPPPQCSSCWVFQQDLCAARLHTVSRYCGDVSARDRRSVCLERELQAFARDRAVGLRLGGVSNVQGYRPHR